MTVTPNAGVPPSRLREEAETRRVAEAEAKAAQAEARELRARLDALERGQRQPNAEDRPPAPDMFADPEGWARAQEAKITQQFEERRINGSFAEAHEEHGEKFATAFQTLQRSDPATVRQIVQSHNPGRELMRWHDRQALLSE